MPDGIGAGTIWAALALRLEQLFQNAQQAQQLMQQLDANMQAAATKASAAASTAAAAHAKGVTQAVQQAAVIQQQAAEQALRVEMSQWKVRIAATAQGTAEQKAILQQYYNWLQTQAAMPGIRPGTLASLNNEIASVTRQINNLGKETQTVGQGIEATFGRMQRTLGAIVGVEVFRYLTTALTQLPQLAFQTEAGFRILERQAQATGQSIDSVHASMQRLADDLHTAKEALAQPVAELMRYGYTVEQIEGIFRGAAASGLLMGKTIDQSIQTVSEALISQRSVLLNEVGIVENLDTAYNQYAKSLGKTADELTAQERAYAAWQMVVRATASEMKDLPILMEGYGGATAEAGLATYRLQKAVGDALLPVMTRAKLAFADIVQAATPVLTTLISLADKVIPALVAVISYKLLTSIEAAIVKLATLKLAISPIAAVVSALAALGLAWATTDRSATANARAMSDHIDKVKADAEATKRQVTALDGLIEKYAALSGKPNKSAVEHEELRKVIDQIVAIVPDAVTGYNDMGQALIGNADAVKKYRDELANTMRMTLEITAAEAKVKLPMLQSDLAEKQAQLAKANAEAQRAKELLDKATARNEQFSIASYKALYEGKASQASQLAEETRALIAEIARLQAGQAQLDALLNNKPLGAGGAGGTNINVGDNAGSTTTPKTALDLFQERIKPFQQAVTMAKAGYGNLLDALKAYRDELRKTADNEKEAMEVRAAAASELTNVLHETVKARLDWLQTAKDKDYIEVNTYAKQISYLENIIDKQDELQMLAEDKAAVQQVLWETRKAQYEEEVKLNNWSAQQQVEKYQELVAAHAVSFEQRKEAEIELADLTARANDAAYKAAVESYDKLTRNVELTAAQRQAIYQREVVDKLANTKKSADAEKAIAMQLLDLQREVDKERQQSADRTRELEIEAIELAGDKTEAAIQREIAARDEALRQVGLTAYQRTLIVQNSEEKIKQIRREAAEAEARELEQWTDSYFQHEIDMGRATTQGYANALREVRRINEERGIFSEELNRKIERLERQAGNEALAITADVESTRMQIRINTLVAGNAKRLAEELQLEKELHDRKAEIQNDETLTVEQKNLKIEEAETNHKAKLAELNRRYTDQEIQIQMSALETLASARELTLQESLDLLDLKRRVEISNAMETTSNLETINAGYRALELKTRQEYAQKAVRAEIEAFGELEDHSIEASKKKIAAWKKTYTDMGDAGKLALEEIAALETKLADEEKRRAEEREQWLVSTGQKAQEVSLLEAVTEAQKKLDEARKAGVGIAEAQQALEKANFDQMRSSIDTAHAYYQFMHQTGKLTDEEFLGRIRDLIDEEMNLMGVRVMNSDTYRQLKSEELQLLQNIRAAEADANIERLQAHEDTTEALLVELQTLERNRDAAKALGTEGAVAAEKYGQAIKRVTGEFASLNQSALQTLKQLQEVVTSAGETDHQRWYRQVNEQISVYQKAAWDRINAMKAEKRTQEEINAEIVKWGTLIGQFTDQQIAARNKVLSGDFWPQLQQNMLGTMLGPLSGLFSSAVDAFKRTNFYTVADSEEQRSRIADALKPLITELSNAVGRRLGVPGAEEGNAQWEVWLQDTLQAGREAFAALWKRAPEWLQDAGSAVTGWIGKVFSGIKDGPIGKALGAAAGPLAAIFLELVKAAEPLKPVWDAMGKVFKLLADIVGMMILPIFKALWPVIKGFGWVMAEIALIIGKAWNALVWLIDQIPFVDMSAYYMNTDDIEKKRDEIGAMQYPGDSSGSSSGKAGTQVMNMTGETRNVFVELLRPLTNLNMLPGLFDNMLQRLDTIVEMLRGLQNMVLEIPEAAITIMRATITVQSADAVYVTGPIQGGSDLGMNAMTAARVGV